MQIGFIGTGTMGLPMLKNLLKKGYRVTAYDIASAALDAAEAAGAERARSTAEAASSGDLVITMLPSSGNVEAAYLGSGGIIEGAKEGRLLIDMSTIDPGTSQRVAARLKERRLRFLDAPVSGALPRAIEGTLTIMVGGEAKDLEAARPILSTMGSTIIHVGPVGSGEVAKLCNNLVAGAAMIAVSEAFRLGEAFGVDLKILTDVIAHSSGATWVMEHGHPVPGINPDAASSRGYTAGFMTDLMAKDVGLAVAAAREKRVSLFLAPAAAQLYRLASAYGFGRKDFSSLYEFLKPASPDAPV
jgi:3-hydroxyisobutyrate dehydrogenase